MKPWKVILATLVIFGSGVITGGLLVKFTAAPPRAPHGGRSVSSPLPAALMQWPGQKAEFIRRLDKQLGLTPQQEERVEQILRDSRERTRTLWESVNPPLRDEIRRIREQIQAELTPAQRQKFDEIMKSPVPARKTDKSEDASKAEPRRRPAGADGPRRATNALQETAR